MKHFLFSVSHSSRHLMPPQISLLIFCQSPQNLEIKLFCSYHTLDSVLHALEPGDPPSKVWKKQPLQNFALASSVCHISQTSAWKQLQINPVRNTGRAKIRHSCNPCRQLKLNLVKYSISSYEISSRHNIPHIYMEKRCFNCQSNKHQGALRKSWIAH